MYRLGLQSSDLYSRAEYSFRTLVPSDDCLIRMVGCQSKGMLLHAGKMQNFFSQVRTCFWQAVY